ncbi:hypothetical protein GCM10008924_20790 [Gracilibacillus halotolerans]
MDLFISTLPRNVFPNGKYGRKLNKINYLKEKLYFEAFTIDGFKRMIKNNEDIY